MARGAFIGGTDYSSQSLKDMVEDIENWIQSLEESREIFTSNINELEKKGYWNSVDYDFKASCYDLIRYFGNGIVDLRTVLDGINSDIKEFHIRLLENLGSTAHEQHTYHRRVWREYHNKEYGEPMFNIVERLYAEGSDMAGDLFDINNLAARLKHFVGMSNQPEVLKSSINVNNHFNSTVTGVQQNYESSNIHQLVNVDLNNNNEKEEIKILIKQFRDFLQSSTSSEKEEVIENINDLEETLEFAQPKGNRIRSFGKSISASMKKMLTMKSFNNIDEVSTKLPNIIENFNRLIEKI